MTTNIHDYSQAEAIILSVDSVSTVVAGLPLIDPTPAPNTVPMSLDTGNIDPAWFDTPDFNLSEIAGSSGGVDMTPIPKSTVKVQAPSGSDIVALGLLADREDILVIATQDSICLDVKPLAKPTSDQLLRSRQIRLALLPRVTLHNLTSLDNSVTVPAHLSAKLPTTSGGSLSAGDLWLITLDWVEGRFKSQPAGWHMTEVFGPYELGVGPAEPSDDLLLDGAIAVFPINSGNPDGTEALPDATYFPAGVRYYVGDISTNASKANSRNVPAHSYQGRLSVSAQPGHTGVIFSDTSGAPNVLKTRAPAIAQSLAGQAPPPPSFPSEGSGRRSRRGSEGVLPGYNSQGGGSVY